jgi:hypothetical protein
MKKYFKFPAESNLGIGIQYIEFDDNDLPIRQIECYGDRLFNSNQKYHDELGVMGLCEQKLTEFGIKIGTPIEANEFDSLWNLSNMASPFRFLLHHQKWESLTQYGDHQSKIVAQERGYQWERMTNDERESFIDDLVHED